MINIRNNLYISHESEENGIYFRLIVMEDGMAGR